MGIAVAARVPVLMWGAPGTGKTSAVRAMADAIGWPCETVIAAIREPSDFAGLPVVTGGGGGMGPPPGGRPPAAGGGRLGPVRAARQPVLPPGLDRRAARLRPGAGRRVHRARRPGAPRGVGGA